jgi:hypothetical protein
MGEWWAFSLYILYIILSTRERNFGIPKASRSVAPLIIEYAPLQRYWKFYSSSLRYLPILLKILDFWRALPRDSLPLRYGLRLRRPSSCTVTLILALLDVKIGTRMLLLSVTVNLRPYSHQTSRVLESKWSKVVRVIIPSLPDNSLIVVTNMRSVMRVIL